MDSRQKKGILLALRGGIVEDGVAHLVPSETKPSVRYRVFFMRACSCTCEDYERHQHHCKHIWAVHYSVMLECGEKLPEIPEDEEEVEPTVRRDWPAYNRAQINEKPKLLLLLRDLCSQLPAPKPNPRGGRPPIPLSDIVFALVYKVYSRAAARQFMADLDTAREKGLVSAKFNFNSLLNYFADSELTPILTSLISASAAPLRELERGNFAVDATGITTSRFRRWVQERDLPDKEKRDWVKLNLICGTKTKVVAAVEVTDGTTNESPFFPRLIGTAAQQFRVLRVSADAQYLGANNLHAATEIGATPFIPFKDNSVADGDSLWQRMFYFYLFRQAEFMKHYGQRNIVECVFSMIKGRFGNGVRSRTRVAMKNEVLCKVICHNLCRVIHGIYESGLESDFSHVEVGVRSEPLDKHGGAVRMLKPSGSG